MKPLWESDHPYYCNEGNFFATSDRVFQGYKTWDSFMAEERDSDLDMNLVFRWDWHEGEDYDCSPVERLAADPYYRGAKLLVFIMGQRKGLYRWVSVDVCRADEPAVREWLKPRLQRLMELWAPMLEIDA